MRLALARERKQDILLRVMDTSLTASRATRALGAPPGIAVGLSPGLKGDFRVAVRAQTARALEHPRLVGELEDGGRDLDVRVTGTVLASSGPRQQAVLAPGASIGHPSVTAGTLGCYVVNADGAVGVLSNNHVLADSGRATLGDPVLSPAAADGGGDANRIGWLHDVVPLRLVGNEVDAAVALLEAPGVGMTNTVDGVPLTGPLGDDEITELFAQTGQVRKRGRTTGLTAGAISAIELDGLTVGYDSGSFVFDRNIEVEGLAGAPFSHGGDSGSVIHLPDGRCLGLLYAGTERAGQPGGVTYANVLHLALSALKLRLL